MKETERAALKKMVATHEKNWRNIKSVRVLGFLQAKKLLFSDGISPLPSAKITIKDALWVGRNVEPRVLEVLPAAILHFPRAFLDLKNVPDDLDAVLAALKRRENAGPPLDWVPYKDLKRWTEFQLPDKRVRPLSEKRIARTYRLKAETIKAIRERAKAQGIAEGAVIELLFRGDIVIFEQGQGSD